ncbi:hypothetical protein SKAU_G00358170 [Synaphobranchus kaupii]|uniref:Uncharacterized protein n=1 Tax=Synaphobranchus kaupii TaxID=118154 RepID=A0A9Q1IGU4_SYNKA|nr:hypothetical protein SKAU_G00358170 [Synaphobranchus kaupii]
MRFYFRGRGKGAERGYSEKDAHVSERVCRSPPPASELTDETFGSARRREPCRSFTPAKPCIAVEQVAPWRTSNGGGPSKVATFGPPYSPLKPDSAELGLGVPTGSQRIVGNVVLPEPLKSRRERCLDEAHASISSIIHALSGPAPSKQLSVSSLTWITTEC